MTDKAQLAGEAAQLEMQVKQLERDLANAKSTVTGGAVGALLGIVLLFFVWPLGGLLLVAGVLAYVTGAAKRAGAQSKLKESETRLAGLKGQLASM